MKELLDYFETEAEAARERHLVFIASLTGEAQRAMVGHHAFTAIGARDLKSALVEIGWSYVENEAWRLGDIFSALSERAQKRAQSHLGLSDAVKHEDALSELLKDPEDASASFLKGEIVAQVNRDVNQVVRSYRDASLRVLMKVDLGAETRDTAKVQVMIDEMNAKRRLWFRDRAGRRIPSQKHIRRLWRHVMRDHWVAAYMATLAGYGEKDALIWHVDPSHRAFGQVMRIGESDYGLDDYEEVFHPNARALPAARAFMEQQA